MTAIGQNIEALPDADQANAKLPDADQVRHYLAENPARGPSALMSWLPLLALICLLGVALTRDEIWAQILPWVALLGLFSLMSMRVKRMRALEREVLDVQELTMQRDFSNALTTGWQLIPRLVVVPDMQARVIAFVANTLDHLQAHEAAIVGYDFLIDRMPANNPASVQLRVHRVIAQLACDRLTDADDDLRKLRGLEEVSSDSPLGAIYRMATLVQAVHTHHYDDAIKDADSLIETVRPLGTDAAYGYALTAYACFMLAQREAKRESEGGEASLTDRPDFETLISDAKEWWSRATLLLPTETMTERYPQLRAMAADSVVATAAEQSTPPTAGETMWQNKSVAEVSAS